MPRGVRAHAPVDQARGRVARARARLPPPAIQGRAPPLARVPPPRERDNRPRDPGPRRPARVTRGSRRPRPPGRCLEQGEGPPSRRMRRGRTDRTTPRRSRASPEQPAACRLRRVREGAPRRGQQALAPPRGLRDTPLPGPQRAAGADRRRPPQARSRGAGTAHPGRCPLRACGPFRRAGFSRTRSRARSPAEGSKRVVQSRSDARRRLHTPPPPRRRAASRSPYADPRRR